MMKAEAEKIATSRYGFWDSICGIPVEFLPEKCCEGVMSFRLMYQGQLLSSNNDTREKVINNIHEIRKQLHFQLKTLWQLDRNLKMRASSPFKPVTFGPGPAQDDIGLLHIAENNERFGVGFIPLVLADFDRRVSCSLDILFLRREKPGKIIQGGDLDNRLNTLFDALRIPKTKSEMPDAIAPEFNPMYCLLPDDGIISEVKVSTDLLLTPAGPEGHAKNNVVLLINVNLQVSEEKWVFS